MGKADAPLAEEEDFERMIAAINAVLRVA